MTRAVVFKTPGLIDIRAFTTFGVNAKPNSTNPIGYFGTGLKYAIAVLIREKLKVELWIGQTKYTFSPKEIDFRGKEFTGVRMKVEKFTLGSLVGRPQYQDLPFTTELGKNWKLWQAFRELETNTRDEAGSTQISIFGTGVHTAQETAIWVYGESFVEEFLAIDKTFLPKERTLLHTGEGVEVYGGQTQHIYYRGLRVLDLDKPTMYTYNFIDRMDLTEDRTLAYQFQVDQKIAGMAAFGPPEAREIIRTLVTSKKDFHENSINWNFVYSAPSDTFREVVEKNKPQATSGALGYYSGYAAKAQPVDPFAKYPRPWTSADDSVVSATGETLFNAAGSIMGDIPAIIQVVKAVNDWKGE